MRIRRLLFFLAPILLGDTSLHAAFGPAPQCIPSAALQATAGTVDLKLPISELGPAIPSYDPEERDYLIRTIVFEASGEPEKAKPQLPLSFSIARGAVDGGTILRRW